MARHRSDIACLNHIAAILIDARHLYARGAQLAGNPDAVARIERLMGERGQLLTDVQSLIVSLRGQPQSEGSMLGVAHKAFLDVRRIFDRDEKAALAEVERGETYLRDEIRKAIRNDDLGAETRAFLGLALDRVVNGEMRIDGKVEEIEHAPHPAQHSTPNTASHPPQP